MKKLLLSLSLILAVSLSAQDTSAENMVRQNDITLSPLELIAGPALNFSYERLLNKDAGIGLNTLILFADEEDFALRSQFSLFYRQYFGKKYAGGFFVEGFVPITTSRDQQTVFNYGGGSYYATYSYKDNTTIGAGIGFGGKWIARNNIVFEVSAGIARRFGDGNFERITSKGLLGIGYRF